MKLEGDRNLISSAAPRLPHWSLQIKQFNSKAVKEWFNSSVLYIGFLSPTSKQNCISNGYISMIIQRDFICVILDISEWAFKCFFKCAFKFSFRTDAKAHWWHLYAFSPEWISIWVFKFCFRTDVKAHWLHLYPLSPEWIFICVFRSPAWTDAKSHRLHLYGFSPVWIFICVFRLLFWTDAKLHCTVG